MACAVTERISAKMANMSFLCAVMVVLIHSPTGKVVGSPGWWWTVLVQNGLCQIAVPFFFLASGFFIAGHMDEMGWWKRESAKRLRTLLIPFLIFNATAAFVDLLMRLMNGNWPLTLNGRLYLVTKAVGLIPFGGVYGALWFVRSLMLLVLIAPFLKRLATPLGLALLFVLYGVFNPYPFECRFGWYTFFSMNMVSFCGMAWFVLGTWLRRSGVAERIASMCGKKKVLLCLTCGGILLFVRGICVLRGWHWAMSCYPGWISIPLVMVGIWAVMPSVRLPQGVQACTFPLYLLHGYAILLLTLTMGSVYGESVYAGAALTLAVSFVLVGITRLAGERVCRVAFGDR